MIKKIIGFILILQLVFLNTDAAFAAWIHKIPDTIEITKGEPEEFKSFIGYAQYNYKAYKYTIKNTGEKTCKIIAEVNSAKKIYRESAERFRKGMFHQAVPEAILAPIAITTIIGLTIIFPIMILGWSDVKPMDIPTFLFDTCIVQPVKSTVMLPYDTIKNIKETKKAKKELKKYEKHLIDKNTPIIIKSGETFEFYAFTTSDKIYFKATLNNDNYNFSY